MSLNRSPLLLLGAVFAGSICLLGLVYWNFPKLDPSERQHLKLPKNMDDAKQLGRVLSRYKERYYYVVLGGITLTYIFLQSFAIPGSIFLSILSGYLFPFPVALALICTCSAVGASICYLLFYLVGRGLVHRYFPDRVQGWAMQVEKHRDNLLYYTIFLRVTPFLPNWFINIASPVIDVPIGPFFFGTFLGVAPPSFIAVQTGTTMQKLTASNAALNWRSILILIVFAGLALLPIILKDKLKAVVLRETPAATSTSATAGAKEIKTE